MLRNSVLSEFNFNLLFFIQRETSRRQSLSWFREWSKKHRFVCHLHKGEDSGCDSGKRA